MSIAPWQVILITLFAAVKNLDQYGTQYFAFDYVIWSWLTGVVLGNPMTGLAIGATVQLMSLGVAGLGGASVPDYGTAGMFGTIVAITSGQDASVGLAVGVTVGMLGVQLDVLFKIINGFVAKKAQSLGEAGNYSGMLHVIWIGPIVYALCAVVPVLVALLLGGDAVNAIINLMPAWFTTGLTIAGKMLPVVGMAMLLNFMPAKKFISFVIIGYVLAAYLSLSILPIALIGGAAAYEYYKLHLNERQNVAAQEGELEDE